MAGETFIQQREWGVGGRGDRRRRSEGARQGAEGLRESHDGTSR